MPFYGPRRAECEILAASEAAVMPIRSITPDKSLGTTNPHLEACGHSYGQRMKVCRIWVPSEGVPALPSELTRKGKWLVGLLQRPGKPTQFFGRRQPACKI